jgi:hypothetical protein
MPTPTFAHPVPSGKIQPYPGNAFRGIVPEDDVWGVQRAPKVGPNGEAPQSAGRIDEVGNVTQAGGGAVGTDEELGT